MKTPILQPEPSPLPAVLSSDLLGGFRDAIICGDNVEVMRKMPTASIDLVLTSPPYDGLKNYNGCAWNFEAVAAEIVRLLKKGGVCVWVVADQVVKGSETGNSMRQALRMMELGLRLHDTMVWNKYLAGTYGKRYVHAWEYMFVLSNGEPKAWNPIMRRNTTSGQRGAGHRTKDGHKLKGRWRVEADSESIEENVWRVPVGGGVTSTDGSRHPAAMPEKLAQRHVASWSNAGDTVLDPFNGSGTTCKVAKELERHYIGIDVNPEYCKIAERRLAQEVMRLFPSNRPN